MGGEIDETRLAILKTLKAGWVVGPLSLLCSSLHLMFEIFHNRMFEKRHVTTTVTLLLSFTSRQGRTINFSMHFIQAFI